MEPANPSLGECDLAADEAKFEHDGYGKRPRARRRDSIAVVDQPSRGSRGKQSAPRIHQAGRAALGRYAFRMRWFHTFKRFAPRRPPTGPLTTKETADAEELRQETLAKDDEPIEREKEKARDRRDGEV